MLRFLLLLLFPLASAAAGAECPDASTTGREGLPASTSVAWLEPGLVDAPGAPLSPEGRTVARFLVASAGPGPAPGGAAGEALAALGRAYGLPRPPDAAPTSDAWLEAAAAEVAAYGILVVDGAGSDAVEHAAVYWRTPLASRIRVVRIADGEGAPIDRERALEALGTCAVEVREWISAPEGLAADFLEREVSASMLVVAADDRAPGGEWVPPERVIDALRFEDPSTADLDAFSAWFSGERPSAWAVTRLVPTLRSSLGPRDLFELFRTAR